MPDRRLVLLLVDGIGDVACPQLESLTPLQVARTPTFDAIAGSGHAGLMDSVEPGRACGSDTAHLAIFGYDPRATYRGRGAFESIGAGCSMAPGDIAFKSNLATLDDASGRVQLRRVDRSFEAEGPVLCNFLNGTELPRYPEHTLEVKYATEHRCGVVLHGPRLSDAITGTDPLKDGLPLLTCEPKDASEERMRERLKDHPLNLERTQQGKPPANVVLLRGCGVRMKLPTFEQRHGLRGCIVAPTKVLGGLATTLGMTWLHVPGATGSYDSRFHLKGAAIYEAVTKGCFDFGFVHVKAVDDTGHDRLWALRVRYIELMDALMAQIVRRLHAAEQEDPNVRFFVMVTADHSTPVMFGDHSHEPVPLACAAVSSVAAALGADTVQGTDLGPLPSLTQHSVVDAEQLSEQAARAREERRGAGGEQSDARGACKEAGRVRFDEVSAAAGALGRFPSSELMPWVRSLLGGGMRRCNA